MSGFSREFYYLKLLTVLYVATLLIFNIVAVKLWHFGPLVFTAGILLVPLTYIFGDVLTEVYGYARTRQIIWLGFICNALMILCIELAIRLPAAPDWHMQNEFAALLGNTPRIAAASLLAYWAGEFMNSYVIARMKVACKGRFMWLRMVASTLAGQAIDSGIFITAAFAGNVPPHQLLVMIASVIVFKVAYEFLLTPVTYKVVNHIKAREQLDFFDRGTDFSPFRWQEA